MKEDLFDKLREIAGGQTDRLNILEEQIDVKLQMEYFKFSTALKKKLNDNEAPALELNEITLSEELDSEILKENLVKLASIEDPKAFRLIEQFVAKKHEELYPWSVLAFQESKMLLESTFLEESQVFISTGLGGKGNMLRYFVVLIGNNITEFSEFQQNLVKSEFEFALRDDKSEMEKLHFEQDIATITVLIPFEVSFQKLFKKAVKECNQYGEFLQDNFLVTNVKTLSFTEIKEFLSNNEVPDVENIDDISYEDQNDEDETES